MLKHPASFLAGRLFLCNCKADKVQMDISREISGLNPRQKEAVMHTEGPLLILAGAGSGKTRVITTRAAYLIHRGVPAGSVLAVTFTNKAAREMRDRVRSMLKGIKGTPVISTFHSLCLRILRRDIEPLGYRKDFTVYDTSDQISVIRNIMSEIKFHDKNFRAEAILEKIGMTKNRFTAAGAAVPGDPVEEAFPLIYPRYCEALKSMNALDFDDLLLLTVRLFSGHPAVCEKYREKFRYIMVDEYQDTNRLQYDFLRLLAGERGNICVVGDDDQSIYGWRGADIGNILCFERDFPGTVTVRLEQNYRSFGHILEAANGVIRNNIRRMEKSLWTERGMGPKVNIFRALDTEEEAEWVAERISTICAERNIRPEDIAVIYRANTFSRPFEEALRRQRIPYSVVGGTSYFDRKEIRDVTAWLRIIANPSDDMSLLRAAGAPRSGLGPAALRILSEFARSNSKSLLEAFGMAGSIEGLSRSAAASSEAIAGIVGRYRDMFGKGGKMGDTLRSLMEDIKYRDYLCRIYKTTEAAFRRMQNLDELIASVTHYESVENSPSLQGFLEAMALADLVAEKEEKTGRGVTLVSFHSSKGLEFPVVFIAGAEEEIIPHRKSLDSVSSVEEERRLFYVGITRAMKELFITYTEHRLKYGKKVASVASRFLEEIPGEVVTALDRFEELDPEEEKLYVKNLYENFMARFDD